VSVEPHSCQAERHDSTTRRSTVGYINFNPAVVLGSDRYTYSQILATSIHEISHILGFSFSRLNSWYNANSNSAVPIEQVLKISQFPTAKSGVTRPVYKIISPLVVQVAREHFNCDSIDGVELENFPQTGTNGSHWEARTVFSDYMTGALQNHPVVTKFSLAFFEDSGWYKSNFSMAGTMQWGLNQGCDFVQKYCLQGWSSDYLCNSASPPSCNYDRTAVAGCNLGVSTPSYPVSDDYSYPEFSAGKYGDQYADLCPFYIRTSSGDCSTTQNAASVSTTRGIKYGSTSRCFINSMAQNSRSGSDSRPSCYASLCIYGKLKIQIGEIWHDCPTGATLSVDGYGGSIVCPKSDGLCIGSAPTDPNVPQTLTNTNNEQFRLLAGPWPSISSVSPTSGGQGDTVVIKGVNFVANMVGTVRVAATCQYIDSSTYNCTLNAVSSSVAAQLVDVSLVDRATGKSCALSKAFTVATTNIVSADNGDQPAPGSAAHILVPRLFVVFIALLSYLL